ncbi:D-alanyl-D-alanine endopeptidase precursor [bacterium BMS3Bbin11]|nr:D-alanyl-D-alanine endopeptidase precursor [bacterium BMS3Abin11]GBE46791.1 D-alanyl-D-alanine endopeptidase precursor [bacterium BMS3Bbin11]GMT40605.1 MAG: D-alanyl-D-alanine carboxypeptidase [bacterium]
MNKIILFCLLVLPLLYTAALAEDTAAYRSVQIAKSDNYSLARRAAITMKWRALNPKKLKLKSASALVVDSYGNDVYAKDADRVRPIASITKLMTAMVTLDAKLPLEQKITISREDRDRIRGTGSRLKYGARLSRKEMITLALMSSENRAAAALGRTYPGGMQAFIRAMNQKAKSLGMQNSRFAGPAGLKSDNVASARDLVTMVRAALKYPFIRKASTTRRMAVYPYRGRGPLRYGNTNRLLKSKSWEIRLSKTGYIREAGRNLTMQAEIAHQPLVIILLNSYGKLTPTGDSNRIRKWIEGGIRL